VRTLRHAVERNKVHHAYLFVGSRGTGKTSMAKILAACLNCVRGPTIEPCGECDSCLSIARATSLDVIEMDAASNNSVDDIRELRASVAYAPVSGGRKVYILDEAHMLSTAAWNAFLKTLEEPPPNTVFVLATTEANKVPPTVVDRCHRFDFHRPSVEQIAAVVRRTAGAESIEIPPAAVAALARSATGSFRDALGTLEQLVTYSGSQIALEDVLAVLGVADSSLLEGTVDAVASGDARRALQALEEAVEQGRDAASFAVDLEARARELLVVQTLGAVPDELALTDEADAALLAQAERVEQSVVVRLLELLGDSMEAVRAGADPRTRLELALVKAARPEADGSMGALLARIERLEAQAGSRAPAAPPSPGVSAEGPSEKASVSGPASDAGPAAPSTRPSGAVEAGLSAPPGAVENAPGVAPPGAVENELAVAPEPEAAAAPEGDLTQAPEAAVAAVATAEVSEVVADGLEAVTAVWPAVVELVRGENALVGAVVGEARPVAVSGDDLTLAFATTAPFLKKKAEDPNNRMIVGEALRAVTGRRWRLSYELREEIASEQAPPAQSSEEDWIRRVMDEFDAEEVPLEWEPDPADSAAQGETGARAATSYQKGA
jgi:DNA polymerase III subunit gamma/tau